MKNNNEKLEKSSFLSILYSTRGILIILTIMTVVMILYSVYFYFALPLVDNMNSARLFDFINRTLLTSIIYGLFVLMSITVLRRFGIVENEKRIRDKYNELRSTFLMSDDISKDYIKDILMSDDISVRVKDIPCPVQKPNSNKNVSVLDSMLYNMAQIQVYYDVSLSQARNSYTLAIVASIFGVLFFIFASIMVIFFNASVSDVIIPAVGGALTELIAGTIFIVYKKSLEQMNRYFDSLQINEKFLSSVNLVDKISIEKQDEMYCEIIRSRLDHEAVK